MYSSPLVHAHIFVKPLDHTFYSNLLFWKHYSSIILVLQLGVCARRTVAKMSQKVDRGHVTIRPFYQHRNKLCALVHWSLNWNIIIIIIIEKMGSMMNTCQNSISISSIVFNFTYSGIISNKTIKEVTSLLFWKG